MRYYQHAAEPESYTYEWDGHASSPNRAPASSLGTLADGIDWKRAALIGGALWLGYRMLAGPRRNPAEVETAGVRMPAEQRATLEGMGLREGTHYYTTEGGELIVPAPVFNEVLSESERGELAEQSSSPRFTRGSSQVELPFDVPAPATPLELDTPEPDPGDALGPLGRPVGDETGDVGYVIPEPQAYIAPPAAVHLTNTLSINDKSLPGTRRTKRTSATAGVAKRTRKRQTKLVAGRRPKFWTSGKG